MPDLSARAQSPSVDTVREAARTTTSPACIPACAAGEFGSTLRTSSPAPESLRWAKKWLGLLGKPLWVVADGAYAKANFLKPAMALAFLKQGVDPKRRVVCPGGYQIGNRYFRCDAVHGAMDMHSAIERSCNTYFWATGLITDPAQTTEMVNYLGYGQEFDLPIPSQRFGTMPNPKWLERKYHRKWQGYDSAHTSIGQGYVSITPVQAAYAMGGLASGGRLKQPHLVSPEALRNMGFKVDNVYVEEYPIQESTVDVVTTAAWGVVNEEGARDTCGATRDGSLARGRSGGVRSHRLPARAHPPGHERPAPDERRDVRRPGGRQGRRASGGDGGARGRRAGGGRRGIRRRRGLRRHRGIRLRPIVRRVPARGDRHRARDHCCAHHQQTDPRAAGTLTLQTFDHSLSLM